MANYSKPMVTVDQGLAEGVYASSGCYDVNAYIHQRPENGRDDYRIQVKGKHAAKDGHTTNEQTLTLSFNQVVTYSSSQGTLVGAASGTTITIKYSYWNNANDNIGLGDIVVTSGEGLQITGWSLTD